MRPRPNENVDILSRPHTPCAASACADRHELNALGGQRGYDLSTRAEVGRITFAGDATLAGSRTASNHWLLRRARIKALEEGTSLNAVLRERVEEYVSRASPAKATKQTFLRLDGASKARGGPSPSPWRPTVACRSTGRP